VRTAADCALRVRALYGEGLAGETGVLHVASAWRAPGGELCVLRAGPAAPRSATDAFALSLARARADAIVTTGKILREEPGLSHALPEALAAWRREVLGKAAPPRSVVLTSGRQLPLGHPLLRGPVRALVFTSRAAAADLAAAPRSSGLEVVGVARPGLRELLAWLARERGCTSAAVEAGPTTALALYEEPLAVDELMLSLFLEPELSEAARGPRLLRLARLEALLAPASPPAEAREQSGRWLFTRYRRRPKEGS
jgi:riboflavin biosynthesis pyrimidine reductase